MTQLFDNHPAFTQNVQREKLNAYQKTLYILRHGETDYNKRGVVQGRGVNTDLNEMGRMQADRFFQAHRHISFDKVYTSTLKRTHQTVEPFLQTGLAWEQHEGFDELDWGENEGVAYDIGDTATLFTTVTEAWAKGDYNKRFTGGESPLDVHHRQQLALNHLLGKEEEKQVLICMHGRAMRILLCALLQVNFDQMDFFAHQNTSLYTLGYTGKHFELLTFNSTQHLVNH